MQPIKPQFGDPVCPSCGGGPYARSGRPAKFIMGVCKACYSVLHAVGNSPLLVTARGPKKPPYVPHPSPKRIPLAAFCLWEGCSERASSVRSKRCAAHRGQHAAPRMKKTYFRACSGCGVRIERENPMMSPRSFCTSLCRRVAEYGPWVCAVRVKRVPVPKVKKPLHEFGCAWCGGRFHHNYSNARYCSAGCSEKFSDALRRARKAGAVGSYSRADTTWLWERFGGECAYCCEPISLAVVQPDHVLALACGGANDLTNLLPACPSCNSDKRDLTLVEWTAWRKRKGKPEVMTTWNASDPHYAHLVLAA